MRTLRPAGGYRAWCIALALVAVVSPAAVRAEPWEANSGGGNRVVVHVFKKGILSAFAHDHHFAVTQWKATAELPDGDAAPSSVQVALEAGSLRDSQEKLSDEDRRKVDAQAAGPDVLDSAHHPQVEYRSESFEAARGGRPGHLAGKLRGTLTARGRSVPLDLEVEASRQGDEWSVRGTAHLKQTDIGIKPFSGFGGTVGVKDEMEIEIALTLLRPAR